MTAVARLKGNILSGNVDAFSFEVPRFECYCQEPGKFESWLIAHLNSVSSLLNHNSVLSGEQGRVCLTLHIVIIIVRPEFPVQETIFSSFSDFVVAYLLISESSIKCRKFHPLVSSVNTT
jgi:hypothetical protein